MLRARRFQGAVLARGEQVGRHGRRAAGSIAVVIKLGRCAARSILHAWSEEAKRILLRLALLGQVLKTKFPCQSYRSARVNEDPVGQRGISGYGT